MAGSVVDLLQNALQNTQMIATSGFLTALECNEFVYAAGGAYSAPQALSWFN